eukprot:m.48963 g.48963  ORF g.48963 m.48963 type:complete len:224 (-) comp10593_c0_seq2:716-1387(-)
MVSSYYCSFLILLAAKMTEQHATVRAPKWDSDKFHARSKLNVDRFKDKQKKYLSKWHDNEQNKKWTLHGDHFDWWMFPIDDGSRPEYNVKSEEDIIALTTDQDWYEGYRESVRLAIKAWGWDTATNTRIKPLENGMGWTNWDVRLAKIIRSLWLFSEKDLFESVQTFALDLQKNEKGGQSFTYGHIVLDEILYMRLPRKGSKRRLAPQEDDENSSPVRGKVCL